MNTYIEMRKSQVIQDLLRTLNSFLIILQYCGSDQEKGMIIYTYLKDHIKPCIQPAAWRTITTHPPVHRSSHMGGHRHPPVGKSSQPYLPVCAQQSTPPQKKGTHNPHRGHSQNIQLWKSEERMLLGPIGHFLHKATSPR